MGNLNNIGLDKDQSKKLSNKLGVLLASYTVFYQNTRGYHWNIKGKNFFELHIKFEELYNDLFVKIDDVAERILTLGFTPEHRYSEYVSKSLIKESGKVINGDKAVDEILNSFKALISLQREILDLSDEAGDEGTNAMMSDYITEQEKLVWMYSSYAHEV